MVASSPTREPVSPDRSSPQRPGTTLLEVMVALAVLSLGLAVVWPALQPPHAAPESLQGLIQSARSVALQRGETLMLTSDGRGQWQLMASRVAVRQGTLDAPAARVELTPTGACLMHGVTPVELQPWNAALCEREAAR